MNSILTLQRILAIICASIPFILRSTGGHRGTISAYHDMTQAKYFYIPLTMAAMLFMINGTVLHQNWYNIWLGISLLGLTFFDQDKYTIFHDIFSISFFLGNAIVFIVFNTGPVWLGWTLFSGVVLIMAGNFLFKWYSVFWAESGSCLLIAYHLFRMIK